METKFYWYEKEFENSIGAVLKLLGALNAYDDIELTLTHLTSRN